MQPQIITVGPLASASATQVSTSQKAAIAGTNYLVMNGAAGSFAVASVCASQTPGAAGALTLNGTLASSAPTGTAIAYLPSASRIYITGGSNESAKTFAVVGYRFGPGPGIGRPYVVTETITGPNASIVSSINQYDQIISITVSAATTGAITVGHYGTGTLDVARRIIFTSGGDDSGITIRPTGTDWNGNVITETVTGANAGAASTVLSYKTLTSVTTSAAVATTITVGTNGVADSPWCVFDDFASNAQVAGQCTVSAAGANYTVRQTMDNPTQPGSPVFALPGSVTWIDNADTAVVAATTSKQFVYAVAPSMTKVVLNSGTGSVTMTVRQVFTG